MSADLKSGVLPYDAYYSLQLCTETSEQKTFFKKYLNQLYPAANFRFVSAGRVGNTNQKTIIFILQEDSGLEAVRNNCPRISEVAIEFIEEIARPLYFSKKVQVVEEFKSAFKREKGWEIDIFPFENICLSFNDQLQSGLRPIRRELSAEKITYAAIIYMSSFKCPENYIDAITYLPIKKEYRGLYRSRVENLRKTGGIE